MPCHRTLTMLQPCSSARPRCGGTHARSACDLHRWGRSARCAPGGLRLPPELSMVVSWCREPHHTGARALYCRDVQPWLCSGRASIARPRCCGSHPTSASGRYRSGGPARSGPGGCNPPFEHGTIGAYYLAPRRTGARGLSCRAFVHWRCTSRTSSARPRCGGAHARSSCDLHRWGRSARRAPGGLRLPPELSTVASW